MTTLTTKLQFGSWQNNGDQCCTECSALHFPRLLARSRRSPYSDNILLSGNNRGLASINSVLLKPDGNTSSPSIPSSLSRDPDACLTHLLEPVEEDLRLLNTNLKKVVSGGNPILMATVDQIFGTSRNKIRPALVFLVSRACAETMGLPDLTPQQRQLAEIVEMIHTASLIHDDGLDESDMRQGKDNVNKMFETKAAVLVGDFIFAQTSWLLANLENLEVIKLISQVIKDFSSGEIKQATSLYNCDISIHDCMWKSYCKTASLIAASTKAASIFSGVGLNVCKNMYNYGKNLGLALQIMDDILDFTQPTEQVGKPAASDLLQGNLTVPVLFALQQEPRLRDLVNSKFMINGAFESALELIRRSDGIERARALAREKGETALKCLGCLPRGPMKMSLEGMVPFVLDRLN